MTIRVTVNHQTCYCFDRMVTIAPHVVRLKPAPHANAKVLAYSLKVTPKKHYVNWQQDPFGNHLARFVFPDKADKLKIDVELQLDINPINPFDFFVEYYANQIPFQYDKILCKSLQPYLEPTSASEALTAWTESFKPNEKVNTVDFLCDITKAHAENIDYTTRLEAGIQSPEETLAAKRGSCRDISWLLIQTLRQLGLAARFTSGYLVELVTEDEQANLDQDTVDLHAWVEVYLPGAGWIGLDPTSGLFANEGHIPLCCTADPELAAPITGTTSEAKVSFDFNMQVQRQQQTHNTYSPYSQEQWRNVMQLAEDIDQKLASQQIHLTQGGEPTFVAREHQHEAQWQTGALGQEKFQLGWQLCHRYRQAFAAQGLMMQAQGKWYPGEDYPRWSFNCYWRQDQQPLWQQGELLADPLQAGNHKLEDAHQLIQLIADELKISKEYLLTAYEDEYYQHWQNAQLPTNANAEDMLSPHGDPVGFVLPLSWNFSQQRWQALSWQLKRKDVFLQPGETAIGYRLPLKSVINIPEEKDKPMPQRNRFEPLPPLSELATSVESLPLEAEAIQYTWQRTALCVSLIENRLHIFLPPAPYLEHFILLLSAIEGAVSTLQLPVVFEGYGPPVDPRLIDFKITPDPGVLEVNMQPAAQIAELAQQLQTIYHEAGSVGLTTKKYLLDGRPISTGGGNHIVLGGATPAQSPFLQRPDLLKSFITFWQRHPSLSYLFSGLFVGPTSQAPRVDEARHDSLYELELALSQIPENLPKPNYKLGDQLLRNLLVDITGNTHRAEICIDKLYSPDHENGRLGLVEFRAFEMPPHWQMCLLQHLLLRAFVMAFWQKPYEAELIRWHNQLHDQFMLPYYLHQNFNKVLHYLEQQQLTFAREWFQPFFDCRFPIFGQVNVNGIQLQLRAALDTWNVLGEQVRSGATCRPVDASTDRLQLLVNHLDMDRYLITCNGYRLPLQKTHQPGQYVVGVRFKAWQLPLTLHPQLKSTDNLVFDIIDKQNHRSIGGCRYTVSHEGGRNYETPPINAAEAESRRYQRFLDHGHSQGEIKPPPLLENQEYPCTLDLRQFM